MVGVYMMAVWLMGRHKIVRLKFRSRIILREGGCRAVPRTYVRGSTYGSRVCGTEILIGEVPNHLE